MKIALFYFSGTGNTKLVSKKWQDVAKTNSIEFDIFPIEKIEEQDFNFVGYDKIGIAYPIHGFNAPKIILDFAKKIKKQESEIPLFIIMVSGEYMVINNSSDLKLLSIIKKKNFKVESEYHYIMPYNMIFRHTEERAYKMYVTMNALVELDVKEYLCEGKPHALKKHWFARPIIWLIRIEQVFAPINGKHFKVKADKCVKCMKCVNSCPTNNIEFKDGKFTFKNKCILCTRCSFNCPTDAFKIGLLNNWRVNGPYKFKENAAPNEIDKHPRYCKKSYIKYYKEAEERLKNN